VNGYRYNARLLAQHIAEKHFGLAPARRALRALEVVPFLLDELAHAPELWTQKGYLARVVTVDEAIGARDGGIVPLAHFVDGDGDACAVAVEYAADGTVVPVVYVRRGGRLTETQLPGHPLHEFGTDEHRRQLAACVSPLLGATVSARR
jgi:hypothetical protein